VTRRECLRTPHGVREANSVESGSEMSGMRRRVIYDTSIDPSRGSFRREIASALGLLVILFNLISGTLLASTAQAGTAPFLDEVFGDRIVICTGAGMIVLGPDGKPISDAGTVEPLCVFCLPLMAGGVDAPVLVALIATPLVFVAETPLVESELAPSIAPVVSAVSPRGPPSV
jgi:hypothetical protein